MKLVVKYFFLADILFVGVVLDFNKHIFLWQTCFLGGLSYTRVILQSDKYDTTNFGTHRVYPYLIPLFSVAVNNNLEHMQTS
jgi:hypothetical protein